MPDVEANGGWIDRLFSNTINFILRNNWLSYYSQNLTYSVKI